MKMKYNKIRSSFNRVSQTREYNNRFYVTYCCGYCLEKNPYDS